MAKYAIPMLLLIEDASDLQDAFTKANAQQETINHGYPEHKACLLMDEGLPAFAYDAEKHEVHSANDYAKCAIPELSEPPAK